MVVSVNTPELAFGGCLLRRRRPLIDQTFGIGLSPSFKPAPLVAQRLVAVAQFLWHDIMDIVLSLVNGEKDANDI